MASLVDILREVMTLTANVGALRSDVDKIYTKVESHAERILKLESREEVLVEKMTNSAMKAVFDMTSKYFDRLSTIENRLGMAAPKNVSKITDGNDK